MIIVGLNNPHSDDPKDALGIVPANSSGWRLWQISGLDAYDYLQHLRLNLTIMPSASPDYLAAVARKDFHEAFKKNKNVDHVIILGRTVQRAFGLKPVLLHPQVVDGVEYRVIPHPSGRTLFYNDPVCRALVRSLLRSA